MFNIQRSASALALAASCTFAHAQLEPVHEFIPGDANGNDAFGISVAVNNEIAAVGALFHNNDEGAVYVYDLDSKALLHKLVPDVIVPEDNFGRSIVVNDQYVIASSIWNGGNGAVFVFDIETGDLVRTITASDGNTDDRFGASLAIDGNILAVGCPYDDWAGDWSGSVYIYDLDDGSELVKFEWDETLPYDTYGIDIDINDEKLLIGASGESSTFDVGGIAYLMNWETGDLIHVIAPEDLEEIGKFGQSVGLTDTHAVIGAPSHDTSWGVNAGAVYVFDLETGFESHKLIGSQGQALGFFGEFLNTDGDRAIIGQWYGINTNDSDGKAYIYEVSTGTELEVLSSSYGVDYDLFGASVAIHGDNALVGAYGADRGQLDVGSVYAFELSSDCEFDLNEDGALNFFDVSMFVTGMSNEDPIVDFDQNGLFNFFDVSAFLNGFTQGCP